jgi:hypothetical protein
MPDSTISGLSAAAVADRAMEVPVNKGGGENAKVTLEQIVDLVSNTISNVLSVAQVPASVTSAELASVTSGVGGSGSVTSDELSAVSSQISLTNSALGSVDARVTSVGQVVSLISDRLSNEISARAASIQTLSNAVTSVDTRVNAVSQGLCVLSNVVSNEISARAASIQTLSDAVTSVEVHASAASAAATSVNNRVNSILSNEISVVEEAISTTLSNVNSAVTNVSANSAAGSATGLQNVINLLSNKISQVVAGGGLTSSQVSDMIGSVNGANYSVRAFSALGTAGTSVKGLQSVINQISNTFSNAFSAGSTISCRSIEAGGSATASTKGIQAVINTISNALSLMHGQTRLITTTIAASVPTALAAINGLTVSVSAGGYYEYRCKLNVGISAANAFKIGITFPGMINGAAAGIIQGIGSVGASAWQSTIGNVQIMSFDEDGSGSVLLSCVKGVASTSPVHIDANFAVCTAGVIFPMYAASVSTSNVKIQPGSHVRIFKLN